MFELVEFVVHVIRGVLSWSLHVALLVYFAAIMPQAVMGLVKAILSFKQFLRKQAIEAALNVNGFTSEWVLEKLKELREFRLLVGDEVATVKFDPGNTVMIAFRSGYFDTIPNHKLMRGDADATASLEAPDQPEVGLEGPHSEAMLETPAGDATEVDGATTELPISTPDIDTAEPSEQPEEEAHAVRN